MRVESNFFVCFYSLKSLMQLYNPNFMFQMKKKLKPRKVKELEAHSS